MSAVALALALAADTTFDQDKFSAACAALAGGVFVGVLLKDRQGLTGTDEVQDRRVLAVLLPVTVCAMGLSFAGMSVLKGSTITAIATAILTTATIVVATVLSLSRLGVRPSRKAIRNAAVIGALSLVLLLGGAILGRATKSVADPTPALSVHGVFPVTSTCADGACGGLAEHVDASMDSPLANALKHKDEELLAIACQRKGQQVKTQRPPVQRSAIWDRLADGAYVSDLYVGTPGRGRFTPGLPSC